jgi:uncharacterized protein
MDQTVRDNVAGQRFELDLEGGLAFIAYRRSGDVLSLDHAEVPAALNGRGIGGRLVAGALDLIRSRGERMIPRCSFVAHFVERHPQYAELCERNK